MASIVSSKLNSPEPQAHARLVDLLRELFQLDQPELDFGIYRVLHAKSAEVTEFLQNDLLPQARQEFLAYRAAGAQALRRELEQTVAAAAEAGFNPDDSPKVKALREKLKASVDPGALQSDVYNHLYRFFRRYYSEGDFLARRVYKPGVYAIPYEGEEVLLYWANKDQYYIKTGEYLRDYAVKLQPQDPRSPLRVHFKLVDAEEGEHGNIRSTQEASRVFLFAGDDFIWLDDGELYIGFHYRMARLSDWPAGAERGRKRPPGQRDLIADAATRILGRTDEELRDWLSLLRAPFVKSDGQPADYSTLEGHLRRYTARNTFDYFIHKDLGSFLARELDFYIKNEVIFLDDVEAGTLEQLEQQLAKVRAIRRIGAKVIQLLAQLENFQKRLWLKKKFVVDTQYCMTLDRVPGELLAQVAANDAQRADWVDLFAIDELPGYSEPLSVDFLRANTALLLDTRHYDAAFRDRLLAGIEDLDSSLNGILIHGDNFQAMRLAEARYREDVKCIYIDPPYNTASSSIPYKNDYRHSSFAAMMNDRVAALYPLLRRDGAIFVSIDKTERTVVEAVLDGVFGRENRIEELIWSMNTNNSQAPNYSTNHEYVQVYARDRATAEQDRQMFREPKPGYAEVMGLVESLSSGYPAVAEVEKRLSELYEEHLIEYRDEVIAKGLDWDDEQKKNDPWKGLYNYSHAEYRDAQGRLVAEEDAKRAGARIVVWQEADMSMPATKQAASTRDPDSPNYRFYRPIHPVTGKPADHPKSGWKFPFRGDDDDSAERHTFTSLDRDNRVAWGPTEKKVPRIKRMLHEVETNVGKSVFADFSDGEKETSAMFGRSGVFLSPKHSSFVARFIQHAAKEGGTVLDGFAGSGSTAHAVIGLNRLDGRDRRYVLAEVGHHFDRVLKPRVLKAVYSRGWRGGKPVDRDGLRQIVKIVRIESYEDTLNNLELRRDPQLQLALDEDVAGGSADFREQYLLRYQLDLESRGSQSLLAASAFAEPARYWMSIKPWAGAEAERVAVDLVETFNWLLGLRVRHAAAWESVGAEFERDPEGRLRIRGGLKPAESAPWAFRTVTGQTAEGQRALVIWRTLTGDPERDDLVLSEWFRSRRLGADLDVIFVNGDNSLEAQRPATAVWRTRLIEDDFKRLMFEGTD